MADSLSAQAEEAYQNGEYERAREIWLDALEEARREGEVLAEARIVTWLGLTAYRLGEYDLALELGQMGLSIKRQHGLREEYFKSYNALGLIAWDQGRFAEAERLFTFGFEAANSVGDPDGIARATNNLGLIRTELGEFDAARAAFDEALRAGQTLADPQIEGATLSNLGMLEVRAGDPETALEYLRRARDAYEQGELAAGQVNALGQTGTAYAQLGDFGRAYAAIDSALVQARALGLRQEEASNLELIAGLYGAAGDHQRALNAYEHAIALNQELGLEFERAGDLRSAAEIALGLDDVAGANRRAHAAFEAHASVGALYDVFEDRTLLAEIAQRAGRVEEADAHLSEADALADSLEIDQARVHLALVTARIRAARDQPERVLEALNDAVDVVPAGNPEVVAELSLLRARALASVQPEKAVDAAREAVAAVERVRTSIGSEAIRAGYLASRRDAYVGLVEQLIARRDVAGAFAVSEAARQRRGPTPHPSRRTEGPGGEARDVLHRIETLTAGLDELERTEAELPGLLNPDARSDLEERLHRAREEYETIRIRTEERAGAAGSAETAIELDEVRAALEDDEVLLAYMAGSERLHVFAVTARSVGHVSRPLGAEDLGTRVRLVRELIDGRPEEPLPALGSLHRELVRAPLMMVPDPTRIRRLIIVADGALAYLPFAALRDERTGRYLVESYVLVHEPSAQSIVTTEPMPTPSSLRGAVFAPFPETLPAAEAEVRSIEREHPGVTPYIGDDATETALRRSLTTADLVHVATHAVLTPQSPLFSRIDLAPEGAGETHDTDGRLEVHEIADLRVGAGLVFLSGCETALGSAGATAFSAGQDYTTLTQVLHSAGARTVVSTLWRIEDDSASRFASAFYRHLRTTDPAQALAWSQRSMIRGITYRQPFQWASYRVSGDARAPQKSD